MRPCTEAFPRAGCHLVSIACFVAAIVALSAPPTLAQQFDYDPDGFWKMPSRPATKGEFGGEDPIGLASRQHIPTDCAINWKDEAGRTFCFASSMSSMLFQDERSTILPKAAASWAKERLSQSDTKEAVPTEVPLQPKPR